MKISEKREHLREFSSETVDIDGFISKEIKRTKETRLSDIDWGISAEVFGFGFLGCFLRKTEGTSKNKGIMDSIYIYIYIQYKMYKIYTII